MIDKAVKEVLEDLDAAREALLYGPGAGHNGLRHELAKWLTSSYLPTSGDVSPDRILISLEHPIIFQQFFRYSQMHCTPKESG
jgi:DNA-binding transcriptional MocR family regulator